MFDAPCLYSSYTPDMHRFSPMLFPCHDHICTAFSSALSLATQAQRHMTGTRVPSRLHILPSHLPRERFSVSTPRRLAETRPMAQKKRSPLCQCSGKSKRIRSGASKIRPFSSYKVRRRIPLLWPTGDAGQYGVATLFFPCVPAVLFGRSASRRTHVPLHPQSKMKAGPTKANLAGESSYCIPKQVNTQPSINI